MKFWKCPICDYVSTFASLVMPAWCPCCNFNGTFVACDASGNLLPPEAP